MSNKTFGTFDETTITLANAAVDDLIDAAFSIGTPTELQIDLMFSVRGDDGDGNEWTYSFFLKVKNYHATTVNTTLKTNLDSWWTETEDLITDSGLYDTIERVWGQASVIAEE